MSHPLSCSPPRRLSRRAVLGALGAATAGSLLSPLRRNANARSDTTSAKYFIGIYMPHGVARELWVPKAGFDIAYEGSVLAPFDDPATYGRSFRDHIVVLEGLDLTAGIYAATTGHDASRVILTGSGTNGANASIDQFLAIERGLGGETALSSLVLGVGSAAPALGACVSYAKGGTPLPKLIDPTRTFEQAFARFLVGDEPAALERAERERRLGRSLLDYWNEELRELSARVPPSERHKLDQHTTALRELEKRVAEQSLDCDAPETPDTSRFPSVTAYQGGEPYFDSIANLQIDLLVHAMKCDVTRFGTLFLNDLSRTGLDPELPENVHIDVAHRYAGRGRESAGGDPASWAALGRQNRYTYSKIARLLQRLDEASLLEQSVVVAMSDMGNPAKHSSRQIPALLSGGWGGTLKGGRHVDLGAEGTPNNRLLVSIQQAFGVESDSFGEAKDPAITTGALALS